MIRSIDDFIISSPLEHDCTTILRTYGRRGESLPNWRRNTKNHRLMTKLIINKYFINYIKLDRVYVS